MNRLREHLKAGKDEKGNVPCGVEKGCPQSCTRTHIHNIGNKINGRNK